MADERVGQQCPEYAFPSAMDSCFECQLLVRRDVRDEAGEERVNRSRGLSSGALPADLCRYLDDSMISEEGQRAVIPQVDHLHIPPIGDQGRHQIHRGLGVIRTAPLLKQRGLLIDRRVGIDLQQLALNRGHLLGPGRFCPLLLNDLIMFIEVTKVVRRPHRQPLQQLRRNTGTLGQFLGGRGKQTQVADPVRRPGLGESRSGD